MTARTARKLRRYSGARRRQAHGGELLSGNPGNAGGRPSSEFREACRLALDQIDAIGIATSIARNTKKAARDRLEALKWLADRGYGRAVQPVTGDDGPIEGTITLKMVKAR